MSPRAIIIGLLGAWLLAYITPWNDWAARNTLVHGSYLPPVLLVCLAAFSGFINPYLGRWRFRPSEIATVLSLVLVVGSVASIGLMRHFPAVLTEPSRSMQSATSRSYWSQDGGAEQVATIAAGNAALAAQAIAHHDRNGDGRLSPDERQGLGLILAHADRNNDGQLEADEMVAGLIRPADGLIPPIAPALLAVADPADPEERNSLEFERIAGAFNRGNQGDAIIAAGSAFTLIRDDQTEVVLQYVDGHDALRALAAGHAVADPSSDARAGSLLALNIGGDLTIDGRVYRLQRVHPPGIPWAPWLRALVMWSPVILAMIAGALALSAIVRHQWEHNERLPMPLAGILATLTGNDGDENAGRPAILSSPALWITAGVVAVIHGFNIANKLGYIPFFIPMELDLSMFQGVSTILDNSPAMGDILHPRISMTMIAIGFLMTVEVSGSMWGSFLLANLVAGAAIANGLPVTGGDLDHGAVGAAGVLCLFTMWVGRHHYLAALSAAVGLRRTPEASAAAPWIWVMAGVCVMLVLFMVSIGTSVLAAVAVTVITFGTMLALARVVAETGAPYVSFGGNGRISGIILGILGPYCGPAVLMPMLMVGFVVGSGDRERLLPHVLHSMAVQDRSGVAGGSRLLVWIGVACLGAALIAFIAMLMVNYRLGMANIDRFPSNIWGWSIVQGDAILADPSGAVERSAHTWCAYGIGAAVFAALSLARVRWTRFPLHPIGLIVIGGWVTKMNWAAFAVGWALKIMVLRYGGQQLYKRLYPVVIGCILGEALVVILSMIFGLVRAYLGLGAIDLKILPS